ncbi:hypothetical protein PFISCL1PPCAC_10079, partial [Pristionchus fissidentatus]
PLLDFNTAMSDFAVMFPTRRRSEIEEILWKNKGAIQESIDDLLAIEHREKQQSSSTQIDVSSITHRRTSTEVNSSESIVIAHSSLFLLEEVKKESFRVRKRIVENEVKLTFEFNRQRRNTLLSEQKALLAQEKEFSHFIQREERRREKEKSRRSKSCPRRKEEKKEEKKDLVDTVLNFSAASRKRWDSFVRGFSVDSNASERKRTTTSVD